MIKIISIYINIKGRTLVFETYIVAEIGSCVAKASEFDTFSRSCSGDSLDSYEIVDDSIDPTAIGALQVWTFGKGPAVYLQL